MKSDRAQRLLDYVLARTAEMTELVERLVAAESPSTDRPAQAEAWRILHEELRKRGCRNRLFRSADASVLVAAPEGRPRGRPFQLLLGHVDTVWPVGTLQTMPLRQQDGELHGPGAYDMKAGIVQGMFAIEATQAVFDHPLDVTPVFLINGDEEIGSRGSTTSIRRLARHADRVFVLEPSMGRDGKLKTARKGIGRFTVVVSGKAAHAGLDPGKGASAILELSLVIQKLFNLNDPERGITVNVGTIDGGVRPNVVAPEGRAVVDVRVRTHEDARQIEQAIHALEPSTPGTRLDIEGRIARPPMEKTEGNQRLWQRAREMGKELDLDLQEETAGGGSDGNTTSLYAPTLDGLGAVGDGAHSTQEFLFLDRMPERTALLACLLSQSAMSTPSASMSQLAEPRRRTRS